MSIVKLNPDIFKDATEAGSMHGTFGYLHFMKYLTFNVVSELSDSERGEILNCSIVGGSDKISEVLNEYFNIKAKATYEGELQILKSDTILP